MGLRQNLLAGLANSIWTALVGLAVVPLYLKYLGMEAYGLIGFFTTTQALISLLDLGLAPTINREVARYSASGNMREARRLLHTLAVVYWMMAGMIVLLIVAFSPLIANDWLQSRNMSPVTLTHAVMLMGLVIACRWPIGLYAGALMGMQHLTVSSSINIAMVTIGSLGAVTVLAFVSPTLQAFFIWQASVSLLHVTAIRWATWRVTGRDGDEKFDLNELKRIWRFSADMSVIAITGIVFTQLDKVLLSKMLLLEEFGHYMLATVVVSGLYIMVTPLFNAMYPRFSALVVSGDTEKLTDLYRLGTRLLATALFPIAVGLAIFAKDLVRVWTRDATLASQVAPVIALLSIGSALHGVMHIPYALQLAYGMTSLPIKINTMLMVILVPLIVFLTWTYGVLGAAIAWLILHVLYVILGTWLTHRHLLKGLGSKWLSQDVGVPLGISMLLGMAGYFVLQTLGQFTYIKLLSGIIFWMMTTILSILSSSRLRPLVLNYGNRILLLVKKEGYV